MSEFSDLKSYLIQNIPPELEAKDGFGLLRELDYSPRLEALQQRLGKIAISPEDEDFTHRFWYLRPMTVRKSEKAQGCHALTRTILNGLFDSAPTLLTPIGATLGPLRVGKVTYGPKRTEFGCIKAALISENPSEWGHERRLMASVLARAGIFARINDMPRPKAPDISLALFPLRRREQVLRLISQERGQRVGEAFFAPTSITILGPNGRPVLIKEQRPDVRQAIREAEQA